MKCCRLMSWKTKLRASTISGHLQSVGKKWINHNFCIINYEGWYKINYTELELLKMSQTQSLTTLQTLFFYNNHYADQFGTLVNCTCYTINSNRWMSHDTINSTYGQHDVINTHESWRTYFSKSSGGNALENILLFSFLHSLYNRTYTSVI